MNLRKLRKSVCLNLKPNPNFSLLSQNFEIIMRNFDLRMAKKATVVETSFCNLRLTLSHDCIFACPTFVLLLSDKPFQVIQAHIFGNLEESLHIGVK